jgi:hypothetical protein
MVVGSCLDGIDDRLIAGAATQVASDRCTYLRTCGMRMPVKQSLRSHQHAGCAEAALYCPTLDKRLLKGMQVLDVSQAARCRNRSPINLNGQDETGQPWLRVQQHCAGATVTLAASKLHVPLMQLVSQQIEQRLRCPNLDINRTAIERKMNWIGMMVAHE